MCKILYIQLTVNSIHIQIDLWTEGNILVLYRRNVIQFRSIISSHHICEFIHGSNGWFQQLGKFFCQDSFTRSCSDKSGVTIADNRITKHCTHIITNNSTIGESK